MTKYTAEDFAQAEFARHEDGRIAARADPGGTYPWATVYERVSDAELAADPGWRIVRDAESLTAREHQDAAWEKAHVVDVIPEGAGYITKWDSGDLSIIPEGHTCEAKARGARFERRLLDPPPVPARPEGAEEWEDWLIEAMPHETMPDEDIALLADRIAARVVTEGLRDVTVIVGADT